MRFMILVKASKESEAGMMPSQQLLTEMGKFNEELAKAGVLLAGEGLHPSSRGTRIKFFRRQKNRNRRAVCRNQRADRRFLDMAGELEGRSH